VEIKVFLVVGGVTLFLQAHLLVVIFIQLRKTVEEESGAGGDEEGNADGTTDPPTPVPSYSAQRNLPNANPASR